MPGHIPDEKLCKSCDSMRPMSRFPKQARGLYGRSSQCLDCQEIRRRKRNELSPGKAAANMRAYVKRNPEKIISNKMKYAYGITLEDYNRMFEEQKGCCAICDRPHVPGTTLRNGKRLHIDHCHDTKKVRGLLCSNCNLGIGNLQHDEVIMLKAISYLKK